MYKIHIYDDPKRIWEKKLDDLQYYIYVIENSHKDIKIGITHNIEGRVKKLSNSNAGGSYIIRVAVSPPTYLRTMEGVMHQKFASYRVKDSEWFTEITFEEVVAYLEEQFNRSSYQIANETRKRAGGYTKKSNKPQFYKGEEDVEDGE